MTITMRELADLCGVSQSTVSLVLNQAKSRRIKASTEERILKLANEHNFRVNHIARRMRNKCTENLSVLFDNIGQPVGDYPDFRSTSNDPGIYGMLKCAAVYDYDLKLLPVNPLCPDDLSYLDKRIGPPYSDGVIFHGLHYRKDVLELVQKRQLPYIILSPHGLSPSSPQVSINSEPAIRTAIKRLIAQGHRKIAWCGHRPPHESYLPARFNGYRDELSKVGIFDESLVFSTDSELAIRKLADNPENRSSFTAIYCANDEIAHRWMQEFKYHGVRVPQDIAVIGFDGNYKYDRISTINTRIYDCGYTAAEELIKAIKENRKPENIVIESIFEERGSN